MVIRFVTYSMMRKVTITGTTACRLEFIVESCTSEAETMAFDMQVTRVVCAAGFGIMAWFELGPGTMAYVESAVVAWVVCGNWYCGTLFETGTMASLFLIHICAENVQMSMCNVQNFES